MSEKFHLQIPEPCHEDWDKMTPGDKGRFCDSCQKTVHDFTGMSDAQLIAFFMKPPAGTVCGRFMDDQLGRNIEIPGKRIPWLKYLFQFTIPIFLTSLKGQSQVNISLKERTCSPAFTNEKRILRVGAAALYDNSKKIFGQVIDEKGSGIPYASVYIKDAPEGTTCDSSGFFKLDILKAEKKISLLVSSIGFSPVEKEINLKKDNFTEIVLTVNASLNKEVVVIAYGVVGKLVTTTGSVATVKGQMNAVKEMSFLQKMKDLFTNKSIRLYPNPVSRSQQVSIEFENAKTEKISVRLFSLDGKLAGIREYEAVEGTNRISYSINPGLTAGAYAIQLINGNGKVVKTDKLVLQ